MPQPTRFNFGPVTANKLYRMSGGADNVHSPSAVTMPSDGDSEKYAFELLEDASGGRAFARIRLLDESAVVVARAEFKYKWNILDDARAGYQGDCTPFRGDYYFAQGPCVVPCLTDGTITVGTPPDGVVGDAYAHDITGDGLDSLDMTGLPDGLTADEFGAITGTPTTAGTYYVTVTGVAPKTGPGTVVEGATCTITHIVEITIAEAA